MEINKNNSLNGGNGNSTMKIWICLSFILLLGIILIIFFLKINTYDNQSGYNASQGFNTYDTQPDYEALQEEIILTSNNDYVGNDSSFYCIAMGNTLRIEVDKHGNNYGVCVLSDGTEVNAFDYYNSNFLKGEDISENKSEDYISGSTYKNVNYKNVIKGGETKERIDLNGNEFVYGEIQAGDITIMDRNLGATTNDITSTGSYGYYYQWGNNYGFIGDIKTSGIYYQSVDTSGYGPGKPYFNDTFMYNYSDRSSEKNDNLWGGEGDNGLNKFGLDIENWGDRQGPCPNGWHVPSIGEWNKLLQEWALNHGKLDLVDLSSLYYLSGNSYEDFLLDFNIPLAGTHNKDRDGFFGQGKKGTYYSSTPCTFSIYYVCGNLGSHSLNIVSSDEKIDTGEGYARAYGNPIRCFKNK